MEYNNKINLIVPPVVIHNLDPHTGIPFLPHMAGYLAAKINQLGYELQVIDCFGINCHKSRNFSEFTLLGIDENEVIKKINNNDEICFIYCKVIEDLYGVEKLIEKIKKERKNTKICLFENIQTTNSFSLKKIAEYLFEKGCDFLILGEPEHKIENFLNSYKDSKKLREIPGIVFIDNQKILITEDTKFNKDLDNLPFPLWEKFNLKGYWEIGFGHPPVKKNSKFVPILSSRGCPFRCKFCVSPTLNPTWRGRTAENVVDEMEHFNKTMNITDFHFSDLDPTVDEKRIIRMSDEIIKRKLKITWKLAQGTKIETIKKLKTLDLMKESGLTFFSFSPESGSKDLMKKLNKPFDYDHALNVTKYMNKLGIKSQACFISGTPPENNMHREESLKYMKQLVKAGVDEIAVFIYSPIPGSYFADQIDGFKHYSQLTRSPTWRKDYKKIKSFRNKMYLYFFLYKLYYYPSKVIKEIKRILTKNFETKMEQAIYKYFKIRMLRYFNKFYNF